jgi:hypothetical protein
MRILLLALGLTLVPAAARADLTLRLERFDRGSDSAPTAHLDLPRLALDGAPLPLLALDEGGGAGKTRRVDPALALILGIIPGFGIGHLLAGSPDWTIWLVADILIAVFVWGPFVYWNDRPGFFPLLSLLVVVERVFEGLSAYQAAGGGRIFRSEGLRAARRDPSPVDLARPVS